MQRIVAIVAGLAVTGMAVVVAHAASVPYEFACSKEAAFLPDPNEHKRVGYVTSFSGLGLSAALATDITVSVPSLTPKYTAVAPTKGKVNVVGIIENLSWNGGVGDALKFTVYMTAQNSKQLKTLQQKTLKSTKIDSLGFWVASYDQERKVWYEQSYPQAGAVSGVLNGSGSGNIALDISQDPVSIANGHPPVYKVTFEVVPAANKNYSILHAGDAHSAPRVKQWGLQVGTLNQQKFN